MNKLEVFLIKITDRLESNCLIGAIRQGMIMMIPLLVVGYMAAMLVNLPIPAYQEFLSGLLDGRIKDILNSVYGSVNDYFSIFLVLSTSVSFSIKKRKETGIFQSNGSTIILVIITLTALLSYQGIPFDADPSEIFNNMNAFSALLVALISGELYYALKNLSIFKVKHQKTNTDSVYIEAIEGIGPAVIIIGFFALLHQLFYHGLHVSGLQELMENMFNALLQPLQNGLGSGLLVIFLTHGLWFFGIHGHNMLAQVIKQNFLDVSAGIYSKTMQDVFVLMGGAGAALCLVVAIFVAAKKKGVRNLAAMAAPSVLFNISEIILFGIPVILNPIFFLPFLLVPISNYLISYAAFYTGLVPHVVNTVDWTTPILLSGYKATDSIAGTILQIVCLTVGVLIYIPFVRLYEQHCARRMKQDVKHLVEEMQQEEQDMRITHLTKREDDLGHIARILASELEDAVKKQELYLVYQPQVDRDGNCIGAEALLRWEHAEFGFIYPPLIIQLAKERKILSRIECFVFEEAASALATIQEQFGEPFKMSVNITNESLEWDGIEACIEKVVEQHHLSTNMFCLEITEQDALSSSINVTNTMEHLQQKGHRFLIDDFGMGHTSMMYLQTNYFDIVKLDGSLTKDVLTNERNSNIIEAIVYLGQSLHFKIIAEYVETETQRDKLKELGCNAFQGYLYSKPIRLKELLEWITERKNT